MFKWHISSQLSRGLLLGARLLALMTSLGAVGVGCWQLGQSSLFGVFVMGSLVGLCTLSLTLWLLLEMDAGQD